MTDPRITPRFVTRRSSAIAFSDVVRRRAAKTGFDHRLEFAVLERQAGDVAMEVVLHQLGRGREARRAIALNPRGVEAERPQRGDHMAGAGADMKQFGAPSQPPRGGENAGERRRRHQVFDLLEREVERAMDRDRGRLAPTSLALRLDPAPSQHVGEDEIGGRVGGVRAPR